MISPVPFNMHTILLSTLQKQNGRGSESIKLGLTTSARDTQKNGQTFKNCKERTTYEHMVAAFRAKWTVHALEEVKMFFGIRFICSTRCVTLDQNHKIDEIITDVFGPSHCKNL